MSLSNADYFDVWLHGGARQSLNGNAVVQSQSTPVGLQISMHFDGHTRLEQEWTKSPDGHYPTVTERWTAPLMQQPIVFKHGDDRLDL